MSAPGAAAPGWARKSKPGPFMRKAGYPSGRYTGSKRLLMVGINAGVGAKTAEAAQAQLAKLGFKLNFRELVQDTMYTKFCNVPRAQVAVCPNYGWQKDFSDGQTMLDTTFNGRNIQPTGNANPSLLDDPKINAAMRRAEQVVDPQARAKAWGEIDRLVTAAAPAIPWIWDYQPNLQSRDVQGAIAMATAQWDISFTSLK